MRVPVFTSRRHFRDGQEQGNGSMRKLFGLATILMALFLAACDGDPALVGSGPPPPATGPGAGIGVSIAM